MKVIFVDFDGVLNDTQFLMNFHRTEDNLELAPSKLMRLKYIADTTKAKIVLTSSWRFNPKVRPFLERFGIDVYDVVPCLNDDRGAEIEKWLADNPTKRYIILDDESSYYSEEQMKHAIITRECYDHSWCAEHPYFEGLQDKHVPWAMSMLAFDTDVDATNHYAKMISLDKGYN